MDQPIDRKRLLKRTGFLVSELGLGAWGIGGKGVGTATPIDADHTIAAYIESGGNFIDTAIGYGESERVIGQALSRLGCSSDVFIGTKSKNGETEETIKDLRADLESSLRNLKRDYVDIYYLHWPPEDDTVIEHALDELERFKQQGKIRAIGASIKGPAVTDATVQLVKRYVDTNRVDVIQLVYSILRQKNEQAIEYAFGHDVGIVVRTSLESGFLTGKYPVGTRFPDDDHRSRWNAKIDAISLKVAEIHSGYLRATGHDPRQIAIQFALNPAGVTSVIVGAKNPDQLRANLESAKIAPLDQDLVRSLKTAYRNFNDDANPDG